MASKGKVLIADTDPGFVDTLRERLTRGGFEPTTYSSSDELLAVHTDADVDVVLVDAGLPPEGGLDACRRLRSAGRCWALILCSDRDDPLEATMAYENGADGVYWKERDLILLEAQLRRTVRARQLCRRCTASSVSSGIRELAGADRPSLPIELHQLTRMEERLLSLLHRSQGELVPTGALVGALWGHSRLEPKNLYDLVSVLREKLERAGWTIVNHRRQGYRLEKSAVSRGEPGQPSPEPEACAPGNVASSSAPSGATA